MSEREELKQVITINTKIITHIDDVYTKKGRSNLIKMMIIGYFISFIPLLTTSFLFSLLDNNFLNYLQLIMLVGFAWLNLAVLNDICNELKTDIECIDRMMELFPNAEIVCDFDPTP